MTLCRRRGLAEFPDSVTARGAKHLDDLTEVVRAGGRAVMLYLLQRTDCDHFGIATDIDPTYAAKWAEARRQDVDILCFRADISPTEITLNPDPVPVT